MSGNVIETERLFVCTIKSEYLESFRSIYNSAENMQFVGSGKWNWTDDEIRAKWDRFRSDENSLFGLFAVCCLDGGQIIGEAGFFNSFGDASVVELGYIIDYKYWGRGFGTELHSAMVDYALDMMKASSVVTRMYVQNRASVALAENSGMELIKEGYSEHGGKYYQFELSCLV